MRIKIRDFIFVPIFMFIFYQVGMMYGIPQFVSFLIVLSSLLLFFIYHGSFLISKKHFIPLLMIWLIICIDKFNNFVHSFALNELISLFFSSAFVLFLFFIARHKVFSYNAWRYLSVSIFITSLLASLYYIIDNFQFIAVNRNISFIVLFFMMSLFFKNKNIYFFLLPVVLYLFLFVTEARTQAMGLMLFTFLVLLIKSDASKKLLLAYLYLAIVFVASITYYAMYFEYEIAHSVTPLFTGRGIMWHYVSNFIISNNYFIYGAPSDLNSLDRFFSGLSQINIFLVDHIIDLIKIGHFHNIYIHLFYNTGLVGLLMFLYVLRYMIVNTLIPYQNVIILFVLMFNFIFFGKSFYGFTVLSFLFLFTLIVPYTTKNELYEN